MATTNPKRLYITTFTFQGTQKRIFFEGEDTDEGKNRYRRAVETLAAVGDSSNSWAEFLPRAIGHFERFGFIRAAH